MKARRAFGAVGNGFRQDHAQARLRQRARVRPDLAGIFGQGGGAGPDRFQRADRGHQVFFVALQQAFGTHRQLGGIGEAEILVKSPRHRIAQMGMGPLTRPGRIALPRPS